MTQRRYRDPQSAPSRRLATRLPGMLAVAASFVALAASVMAAEPVQGVTDSEILVGTITDLSGVTAIQGVNSANAIRLAFDEANAKGGIHGRKIRYIVEDSQYQVPRAVQAILQGKRRVLLTLATGTGKTVVAFQICWKLTNSRWNRTGYRLWIDRSCHFTIPGKGGTE
jgi:branched-chain amino acid transport system substrate-binding protein